MSIRVTFDIQVHRGDSRERQRLQSKHINRIRSMLERLGWRRTGNTGFEYPADPMTGAIDDWFHQIAPAITLLGGYATRHSEEFSISRFTITADSDVTYDAATNAGNLPHRISSHDLANPGVNAFGKQNLLDWLSLIRHLCPYRP